MESAPAQLPDVDCRIIAGFAYLDAPYVVEIAPGWVVTVPVDTSSDGATVPRALWPIIGPPIHDVYFPAAVVHDYLVTQAGDDYSLRVLYDYAFFRLLERCEVPYWKRAAMFAAVRGYTFARFLLWPAIAGPIRRQLTRLRHLLTWLAR